MRFFLLLFIIMPIVEMVVLIEVGSRIGALPTVGLVLLTAVVGLALLRRQGVATLLAARQKILAGEIPLNEMLSGIFLAIGGALLLTPGFVTDAVGFCCLIPGPRHVLIAACLRIFKPIVATHTSYGGPGGSPYSQGRSETHTHTTIEGEYSRDDKRD